jgi:DNA-binding Lrp family transcriptional regulator
MTVNRIARAGQRFQDAKGLLDPVNVRILRALQADPRISMSELGRRVGMSAPAVTERVQRLEEVGVILGYRLEVDPAAVGFPVAAWVRVRPGPGQPPRSPSWPPRFPRSSSATGSPERTASDEGAFRPSTSWNRTRPVPPVRPDHQLDPAVIAGTSAAASLPPLPGNDERRLLAQVRDDPVAERGERRQLLVRHQIDQVLPHRIDVAGRGLFDRL